ncbi:hypothetical protein SLEP1_g27892 [Rubroshorea leprosula]|uniref:Uncharacterized protein n=1 Tax=Rubroshorea leprosula TaxID=152421 RepID=A0AAV5K171_9ROSI|nr:hypothetical protein SLEP1_g27892 [Rubroshorea leprosula]
MALISTHNPWLFVFGVLGNISSFVVFLAPIPTFYQIWKKKSTEGFQSLPYLTALFSAMLWIYYALLKSDAFLLITINAFGCVVETIYIAVYITYAPRKARYTRISPRCWWQQRFSRPNKALISPNSENNPLTAVKTVRMRNREKIIPKISIRLGISCGFSTRIRKLLLKFNCNNPYQL